MYFQQLSDAKEAREWQFQHNLQLWNLNNEYNSPTAQMQRLIEAGINPNLAYAKGTISNVAMAGNVSKPDTPSAPHGSQANLQAPNFDSLGLAQLLLQQKMQEEQIKNLESTRRVNDAQAANLRADADLKYQQSIGSSNENTLFNIKREILEVERDIKKGDFTALSKRLAVIDQMIAYDLNLASEKVATQKATTAYTNQQTETSRKQGMLYDSQRNHLAYQNNLLTAQMGEILERTRSLRMQNDADESTNYYYKSRLQELNQGIISYENAVREGRYLDAKTYMQQLQNKFYKWKTDDEFINWLERIGVLDGYRKMMEQSGQAAAALLMAL